MKIAVAIWLAKFFGLFLINVGLHMMTKYIPINILADFIIYLGLSALIIKIQMKINKRW